MGQVKILSVVRTGAPDELRVTGTVAGHTHEVPAPTEDDPARTRTELAPVTVSVWESALYGEAPDPDAKDADGRHERAPVLGGAEDPETGEKAPEHDEVGAGPRAVKVPTTDKQRQAYLRAQLLEAVPSEPDTLDHLAD